MRTTICALALLLLASCGPSKGDIYENLLTGKRIEIDGVTKGDCISFMKAAKEALASVGMGYYHEVIDAEGMDAGCAWSMKLIRPGDDLAMHYAYVGLGALKARWKKIN